MVTFTEEILNGKLAFLNSVVFKAGNEGTIFTQEVETCYVQNFLGEALNLAVLDSGCLKPVCGEEPLKCYVENLCDDDRKKIQELN